MNKLILPVIIAFVLIAGANAKTRIQASQLENLQNNVIFAQLQNSSDDSLLTTDQLKSALALSDSQTVVVDSILKGAAMKLQNVSDPGQQGQQVKSQIVNSAYSDIEKVLTDDQRSKFEALIAQKKGG